MAINSELTSPKTKVPPSDGVPPEPLDTDQGEATAALPAVNEHEQILEELRLSNREQALTQRRNLKLTLDKATFGITGVIALAFVVWGFADKDGLATTSKDALAWVMEYTGWLFMVLASLFVVFVLRLALGKIGHIPL